MTRIVAPYLKLLTDATMVGAFDEMLKACLIEGEADLYRLATIILRPQATELGLPPEPDRAAGAKAQQEHDQLILYWLEDNSCLAEVGELVLQQIERNKLGEALGKLWQPAVLGVGLLKMLNSLPAHLRSVLQLSLTDSAAGTESGPPSESGT